MITSIELLNANECARVESQIKELRDCWVPRGSQVNGFFTLGAASYLDDLDEYHDRRAALNPVLRSSFGWLYDKVVEFLERRLHAPVTLADNLALPGFHIWLAPAVFVTPDASVHFDLQYLRTWPKDDPEVDYSRPLSFTLPIRCLAAAEASTSGTSPTSGIDGSPCASTRRFSRWTSPFCSIGCDIRTRQARSWCTRVT